MNGETIIYCKFLLKDQSRECCYSCDLPCIGDYEVKRNPKE